MSDHTTARITPASLQTEPGGITIGVVSDTHIPDRVTALHPGILPALESARVQHILHTGDVSIQRVLDELGQVAQVSAVRGNRDLLLRDLPMVVHLELGGARITLLHGHGGWGRYMRDKFKVLFSGYQLDRYLPNLLEAGQQAQAIVFGHTHFPEIIHLDGRLLFNPGSACMSGTRERQPSIGLLHISPGAQVTAELIQLSGWRIKNWRWVAI